VSPRSHLRSIPLIALNIAIGLVVVGATAAYGALSVRVQVTVDGHTETIRTFGDTVDDVLRARDVTVRDGDRLNFAPSHRLADGDEIVVEYAKPVTLAVDGDVSEHIVFDPTVGEALDTLGVTVSEGAYLSEALDQQIPRRGDTLVVSNVKDLVVVADGEKHEISTNEPTVAEVVAAAGVELDADDEVKPGADSYVKPDTELKVVRIKKVNKTETVDIDFDVEVRKDDDLMVTDTQVVSRGKDGRAREVVTLVYADGKLRERIVNSSTTLEEPVTQVVRRGTQTTPPDSVWDKIAQCESGGNWSINTGNGYYGGLQFSAATWRSVGGPGLPHQHSREVQIKYAKILQARAGWGQWGCAHARFN